MGSRFLGNVGKSAVWVSILISNVFRRFLKEGYTNTASSLTYTTILALVPVTIVVVTILSILPQFQMLIERIQTFIIENFVPEIGQTIKENLNVFVAQAKHLPTPGLIFLFILAILMILLIERALNTIWRVPARRKGIGALIRYILLIVFGPLFLGVSLWATSYLISLPFLHNTPYVDTLNNVLATFLPLILTIIAFTALYIILPNCKVPLRFAFLAAFVIAIIMEVAKKIFVFYITQFPTYKVLYGTLATIPIFLLWIYISWILILLGGLLANELTIAYYGARVSEKIPSFWASLMWLSHLWEAKQKKKGISFVELYAMTAGHSAHQVSPELQLAMLEKAKIIRIKRNATIYLEKDLSQYTLKDFYDDLPWKLSSVDAAEFDPKLLSLVSTVQGDIDRQLAVPLADLLKAYK